MADPTERARSILERRLALPPHLVREHREASQRRFGETALCLKTTVTDLAYWAIGAGYRFDGEDALTLARAHALAVRLTDPPTPDTAPEPLDDID